MGKETNNVVEFRQHHDPNADINEMKNFVEDTQPPEAKYCPHDNILVSEFERSIKCRLCGAQLDPFGYLLSLAKKETRLDFQLRTLRSEIDRRRLEVENLKREETNTRARIKNAKFRLIDVNNAINEAGETIIKIKGF